MDPILHAFMLCLLTSLSAVSTLSTLPQLCLCEVMSSTATQDSHEDGLRLQVEVDGRSVMATTDTTFLCATLDWYPQDRCSYGSCSWDHASILYLDLSNSLLEKSLVALSPLRLRLGGTVQDQIVYDTKLGNLAQPCLPLVKDDSFISDYRGGCLSMERWIALTNLFARTGTLPAFGLNALYNRNRSADGMWGPWDSSNAHDFIKFTVDHGIFVEAWELGNELTMNHVVTSIPAKQYAEDVKQLRSIITTLYKGHSQQPLIVAPDSTGNVAGNEYDWYITFLNESGPGVLDGISRHIYNLGPGNSLDLVEKILNYTILDNDLDNYRAVQRLIQTYGPWATAWVGEAGGAYNSGKNLVSNAFVNSFWYLDQLGMAATFNTKAYCRQTLIGGNYGLLNSTTFRPNPDLYSAILWKRLMGRIVLATKLKDAYPQLRSYTHCQAGSKTGGLTVLLINLSNSTLSVVVDIKSPFLGEPVSSKNKTSRLIPNKTKVTLRHEYHLSASNGDPHSQTSLLNGTPLEVTPLGDLPNLNPVVKENISPVSIRAFSIAFVALPDAQVPVCM